MENWLVRARRAAGKTEEECATALGQPLAVYRELEQHPGRLTLNEVGALRRIFDEAANSIMEEALRSLCR